MAVSPWRLSIAGGGHSPSRCQSTWRSAAAGYGFAYGLWPIAWIIVAAVFLYKLTVKSGQFEVIRSSVLSITDDQRLQVLLIGFCFGALPRRCGRLRAPVAITAALLRRARASTRCTRGPVPDRQHRAGSLRRPGHSDHRCRASDRHRRFKIGAMTGRQLPLLSLFVPFWLVFMMDGLRGVRETWPAALVAGLSFAVTQYFTSNFIGPELPDITSALASLVSLTPVPEGLAAKTPPATSSARRRLQPWSAPASVVSAEAHHRGFALQPRGDFQGLVAVPDPDRAGDHLDAQAVQGDVRRGRLDVQLRVQFRHPAPGPVGHQGGADRCRADRPPGGVRASTRSPPPAPRFSSRR